MTARPEDIPLIKPSKDTGSPQDLKWMNDITKGASLKNRNQTITGNWTFTGATQFGEILIASENNKSITKLNNSGSLEFSGGSQNSKESGARLILVGVTEGGSFDGCAFIDAANVFGSAVRIRQNDVTIAQFGASAVTLNQPVTAPNLLSGTYTPTITNSTNVSSSTGYSCQYMRVGTVVTVSGRIDINTTASGASLLFLSLPIASSLASPNELGGSGSSNAGPSIRIVGNSGSGGRAQFDFSPSSGGNKVYSFSFTYRIL